MNFNVFSFHYRPGQGRAHYNSAMTHRFVAYSGVRRGAPRGSAGVAGLPEAAKS